MAHPKVGKMVQDWFRYANMDLIGARSLYDLKNENLLPLVAYHCEQAVEKSIKGYLAYLKIDFKRIHDIAQLMSLINPISADLKLLLTEAHQLTPYAIGIRYPDSKMDEVTEDDVVTALQIARKVYEKMTSLIPFESQWDI